MLKVLLDGSDITARIIGETTVLFRERASGTATFVYQPTSQIVLPTDLIRKPVVIQWDDGAVENLFTGAVNDASWDLDSRTYTVQCSNFFQEQFEGKTNTEIEALIPEGKYSENVSGPRRDGWQYAQSLMQTAAYDYYIDRSGVFQSSVWERGVGATPTFDLGAGHVLNSGAYALEMAKGRDVQTRYALNYKYRTNRWKRRKHSFVWDGLTASGAWCTWLTDLGYPLPTRETVSAAASGTGWVVSEKGIGYSEHPESGTYCTPPTAWVISPEAIALVAVGASWEAYRKWAQTITEEYQLTVNVPSAQAAYTVTTGERSAVAEIEADDPSWERQDNAALVAGLTWQIDALGDDYTDIEDETVRTHDIETLLALANTSLHAGFRQNYVSVSTELIPTLDLAHTVRVDTPDIEAKGKVAEYEHILSSANWTTRIKIAVCHGAAGASDPLTSPGRPNTAPGHAPPSTTTNIPTRVGGCPESPDYDPSWPDGWMTNQQPATCVEQTQPPPEKIYPLTFVVTGPDIEDEGRNEVQVQQPVTYNLGFAQDVLVLK